MAGHKAMGAHQSAAAVTTEWLTPPAIIEALGGPAAFDLDPCAPELRPWPTARQHYTRQDNGLLLPWSGRVWLNPPYSTAEIATWLGKLAGHGCGTALIFARTETDAFFANVWERASAVLFIRGRLHFHYPDGRRAPANSGAPSVLIAYGRDDTDILASCPVAGQFVPLRIPRSVIVDALSPSWADLVAELLRQHGDGPVSVADIYRAAAKHPKARSNGHVAEKVRQTLQRGEGKRFRRLARGLWAAVGNTVAAEG